MIQLEKIMTTKKVGIIGAGQMAKEHIRAFNSIPNAKLTGIYSRTFNKSLRICNEFPGLQARKSIKELTLKDKPDLIVVAVPILSCLEVCQEVFKWPCNYLIEKPAGKNLEEAQRLEELAIKSGVNAFIALNRRFYSSIGNLQKELVTDSSKRLVTILDQEDTIEAARSGQPEEVTKNWMYANSVHLIDLFNYLCRGKHLNTEVLMPWKGENTKHVVAKLDFSSGDTGLYQAVWNSPGPWSITVNSDELRAELRPLENLYIQRQGSRTNIQVESDNVDIDFKPGLIRQAEETLKCCMGEKHRLVSIHEANESMQLVNSIYKT